MFSGLVSALLPTGRFLKLHYFSHYNCLSRIFKWFTVAVGIGCAATVDELVSWKQTTVLTKNNFFNRKKNGNLNFCCHYFLSCS